MVSYSFLLCGGIRDQVTIFLETVFPYLIFIVSAAAPLSSKYLSV